jgi:hypothetical protein
MSGSPKANPLDGRVRQRPHRKTSDFRRSKLLNEATLELFHAARTRQTSEARPAVTSMLTNRAVQRIEGTARGLVPAVCKRADLGIAHGELAQSARWPPADGQPSRYLTRLELDAHCQLRASQVLRHDALSRWLADV